MRWTRCWSGRYTYIEYARFAEDLVILIDAYNRSGSPGFGGFFSVVFSRLTLRIPAVILWRTARGILRPHDHKWKPNKRSLTGLFNTKRSQLLVRQRDMKSFASGR
jgi:hypothetical protein